MKERKIMKANKKIKITKGGTLKDEEVNEGGQEKKKNIKEKSERGEWAEKGVTEFQYYTTNKSVSILIYASHYPTFN